MRTVKQRQTFRDKREEEEGGRKGGREGGRKGGRGMIWSSIS